MRIISLSAAAFIGAALFVPMGTATAAGETCQGQAATVVGTPGGQIVGTEGADVIVTNGATRVDALGGDDVVCATGGSGTITRLGAGADTFVSENGQSHQVLAGTTEGDTEADVIRLDAFGSVSTGTDGQPNADTIEAPVARIYWHGTQTAPGSVNVGGGGSLYFTSKSNAATLDARNGTMTAADTSLAFAGFTEFSFRTPAEYGLFTFHGADRTEHLRVDAPATYDRDVALGGGDDSYESNGLGGKASRAKGNGGTDQLRLDLSGHRIRANLGRRLTADGTTSTRIRGFEDYVMSARRVNVLGTDRGERMDLIACRVRVDAGPGKDVITHSFEYGEGDEWTTPRCGKYRAVIRGGRGADVIQGGPGNDRLIGGRGRDRVDGGPGRDVCQAERVRKCEKRI